MFTYPWEFEYNLYKNKFSTLFSRSGQIAYILDNKDKYLQLIIFVDKMYKIIKQLNNSQDYTQEEIKKSIFLYLMHISKDETDRVLFFSIILTIEKNNPLYIKRFLKGSILETWQAAKNGEKQKSNSRRDNQ